MIDAAKRGDRGHSYCVCSFYPLEALISDALDGKIFSNINSSSSSRKIAGALTHYLHEEVLRIFNQR